MGGGSDKASKQAEANERERRAQISSSVGRINDIFNDPARTGQQDQLSKDTTQFFTDDLNEKKLDTDRNTKFALARNGQVGGSVQVDTNRRIGKDYVRGLIEAQRRGNAAGADLRAADEQGRSNLLAMAQSGLDATTASSQAASTLRNNLLSSKATSTANSIGDIFGSFADVHRKSQEAAERRRGEKHVFETRFKPGFGYGGGP